jgi:hypothetical protein
MRRRWGAMRMEGGTGHRRRHWVDVRRHVERDAGGENILDAIAAVMIVGERLVLGC